MILREKKKQGSVLFSFVLLLWNTAALQCYNCTKNTHSSWSVPLKLSFRLLYCKGKLNKVKVSNENQNLCYELGPNTIKEW